MKLLSNDALSGIHVLSPQIIQTLMDLHPEAVEADPTVLLPIENPITSDQLKLVFSELSSDLI